MQVQQAVPMTRRAYRTMLAGAQASAHVAALAPDPAPVDPSRRSLRDLAARPPVPRQASRRRSSLRAAAG